MLKLTTVCAIALLVACAENQFNPADSINELTLAVTQTSAQLASGTTVNIAQVSTDSTKQSGPRSGHHSKGKHKYHPIDGLNLLAPTEELLAIGEAESAGDFRGFRISKSGGATITHYDSGGNVINLTSPADGPQGCSFSGKQFPKSDSLLSIIAKTIIDFGTGTTVAHDSISITRSGKIIITRIGDKNNRTETTTFENYLVNGNKIEGTKIRTNQYSLSSGQGVSTTKVIDGKITFKDGKVATWSSDRTRTTNIVLDSSSKPVSGTITTEGSTIIAFTDGTILYAHTITKPLIEDVACRRTHRGPVSGIVETKYNDTEISVDFGDGSCSNKTISITINGTTTTKTLG